MKKILISAAYGLSAAFLISVVFLLLCLVMAFISWCILNFGLWAFFTFVFIGLVGWLSHKAYKNEPWLKK